MLSSAICVIVKNEPTILQQLAYHFAIGFDGAIVIDNMSTDGTYERLQSAARYKNIRLHRWGDDTKTFQIAAYNIFRHAYAWEFDRIAFIDADEYIAMPPELTLRDWLVARSNAAALAMSWHIFGSAGHKEPPDVLDIEAFRFRDEPNGDGKTRVETHIKSIVDPLKVIRCVNPHYFEVNGDYLMASGATVNWSERLGPGVVDQVPDHGCAKVNHLYLRHQAAMQARSLRRRADVITPPTIEELDHLDSISNCVEDLSASRWAPEVHRQLSLMRPF